MLCSHYDGVRTCIGVYRSRSPKFPMIRFIYSRFHTFKLFAQLPQSCQLRVLPALPTPPTAVNGRCAVMTANCILSCDRPDGPSNYLTCVHRTTTALTLISGRRKFWNFRPEFCVLPRSHLLHTMTPPPTTHPSCENSSCLNAFQHDTI